MFLGPCYITVSLVQFPKSRFPSSTSCVKLSVHGPIPCFAPSLVHSPGDHADRADLLPAAELHNLLQEFSTPLSNLLGSTSSSEPSPLSKLIPLREDMLKYETVPPGVAVRWVLGVSSGVGVGVGIGVDRWLGS